MLLLIFRISVQANGCIRKMILLMANIDAQVLNAFFGAVTNIITINIVLINRTLKIVTKKHNYDVVRETVLKRESFILPSIIQTKNGDDILLIKDEYWRCFEFYDHAYTP